MEPVDDEDRVAAAAYRGKLAKLVSGKLTAYELENKKHWDETEKVTSLPRGEEVARLTEAQEALKEVSRLLRPNPVPRKNFQEAEELLNNVQGVLDDVR